MCGMGSPMSTYFAFHEILYEQESSVSAGDGTIEKREFVVERITVINFGVNDRGSRVR